MATSDIGLGLKGLVITPPVLGRISIGRVVEKDGMRLPEKDDQFTLTTQVQDRDGWLLHPLDQTLRGTAGAKLRSIPVRLLFNRPELNLRSTYSMFDRKTGRPLCTGNGEHCQRSTVEGLKALPCPGPSLCDIGQDSACKAYGRLNVLVTDDDPTGTFIFRTTGYNSIRTLTARMAYLSAASGGLLACLPLELKLRGKSTAQSYGRPVYFVDLVLRSGLTMEQALSQARELDAARKAAGFDQAQLDEAAAEGFAKGVFEEGEDEGALVLDEFFPSPMPLDAGQESSPRQSESSLSARLETRRQAKAGAAP